MILTISLSPDQSQDMIINLDQHTKDLLGPRCHDFD